VKVGDLVKCHNSIGVIVEIIPEKNNWNWLEVYWDDGELDGVPADDVEVISDKV